MRSDCQFRFAIAADAPLIRDIANAAYNGPDSHKGWTPEIGLFENDRITLQEAQDAIAAPGTAIILCENSAGPVGCAQLDHIGDQAYFGLFSVLPELQGAGVGRAILEHAEACAVRLWECRTMKLTVLNIQTALTDYYLRRGFVRTGERIPFAKDERNRPLRDFDQIVLLKTLF